MHHSLKSVVLPTADRLLSCYSCSCKHKWFRSAKIIPERSYSLFANNRNSHNMLHTLCKTNNAGSYVRNFSSQAAPELVTQHPMVLKFLSDSTPVVFAQESLMQFHDVTCLPWWATIITSTVLLRTVVTFPLAVYQNHILARYENVLQEMPAIVKELKAETDFAVKKFKWTEKQAKIIYNRSLKKQMNKLIIRDNCHPAKATLLLWVQIPLWICLSASLRNLVYMLPHHTVDAEISFIQLTKEGLLWFSDLTVPDSLFMLPVIFGLTNLAIIELVSLSKVKPPGKLQKFLTNLFRFATVGMMAIATQVPSCLAIYWTTSSVYGLVQNLVLMSPRVRKFFRIPEMQSRLKHPYRHVYIQIKDKVANLWNYKARITKEQK